MNLWRKLSGSNNETPKDFKDLIAGKAEELQLSEENLRNWGLLEDKLNKEIENTSTDETDTTTSDLEMENGAPNFSLGKENNTEFAL